MTIPVEWRADTKSWLKRMMSLVDAKSFKQTMTKLLEQGLVYAGDDGYGITDKGKIRLLEDYQREGDELLEQAQNYSVMTENERVALMFKAVSLHFPNMPEDATHDECAEVLMKTMQLLGFEIRLLDTNEMYTTYMSVTPPSIH